MPFDIGPLDSGKNLGARRLLLLADYLEKQPPESYGQGRWRVSSASSRGCGTVQCAFGHGVTGLGELLGVRWATTNVYDETICRLDGSVPGEERELGVNLTLAKEVFELTSHEADALFAAFGEQHVRYHGLKFSQELTPKLVAESLRAFATKKIAKAELKEHEHAV